MKLLLEGAPGVGKTTVARGLMSRLQDTGVAVSGFLTTEMREAGRRVGFRLETADGEQALLAHVDVAGPPRIGRYGVDLDAIDRVALPALEAAADVVVLDELGGMELASPAFRDAVQELFDERPRVVATVHARRHEFTDRLKRRDDIELIRVTRDNRDRLPRELAGKVAPGQTGE